LVLQADEPRSGERVCRRYAAHLTLTPIPRRSGLLLNELCTKTARATPRRLPLMLRPIGLALRGRLSPFSRGRNAVIYLSGLILRLTKGGESRQGSLTHVFPQSPLGNSPLQPWLTLLRRFAAGLARTHKAANVQPWLDFYLGTYIT
jgi:hypothetical protein